MRQYTKNGTTRRRETLRRAIVLLSFWCGGLVLLSGCGSVEIKPWVKPYERAHLADPIMSFSRNPIEESYLSHVYDAREGMRGAEGGAGGGCGCN